jgi:hypothetical protein
VVRQAPFTVSTTLADVKLHGESSGLVTAVVADLETPEARQQSMPAELQTKTADQLRAAALEGGDRGEERRSRRGTGLQSVARLGRREKVAEAAKEGGFLGFGGARVSEQERFGTPGFDIHTAGKDVSRRG